jgi:type II secretory pathway predicted ATPase ExeA
MIQAYFGLKRQPFTKELKTEQMFETFDLKEAAARLQILKQSRGLFCLTGEPGAGKTSALRRFVNELNPQTHVHCYTPHATINRGDLYRQINQLLKLPPRGRKSDLFEQIQRGIFELHDAQGKTPVIILDEAHLMDHETLTELILITNFQMDSRVPFLLVLIAQPDLRETLKRRIHEPLNQRITLRYHMAGIQTDEEAGDYVKHHLKIAGRTEALFDDQAISMLRQLGQGLPRKIGNLAHSAMTIAMVKRSQIINSDLVIQASQGI